MPVRLGASCLESRFGGDFSGDVLILPSVDQAVTRVTARNGIDKALARIRQ